MAGNEDNQNASSSFEFFYIVLGSPFPLSGSTSGFLIGNVAQTGTFERGQGIIWYSLGGIWHFQICKSPIFRYAKFPI